MTKPIISKKTLKLSEIELNNFKGGLLYSFKIGNINDYIIETNYIFYTESDESGNFFSWQIPCLVFFKNVWYITIDLNFSNEQLNFEIIDAKYTKIPLPNELFNNEINFVIGDYNHNGIIIKDYEDLDFLFVGEPTLCEGLHFDPFKRKQIMIDNQQSISDFVKHF